MLIKVYQRVSFADCTCEGNAFLNALLDFNSFKSFGKLFHTIAPLY